MLKVGLKRIDAAIDALHPLGFSKNVVRETVKALLKVYGGSGWVFIEEASYKVVIETILEEEEKCLMKKDGSSEDGAKSLNIGRPSDAGTSREVVGIGPTCFSHDTTEHIIETESEDSLSPAEGRKVSWKNISCVDNYLAQKQIDMVLPASNSNCYSSSKDPCRGITREGKTDGGLEESDFIEPIHSPPPLVGLPPWIRDSCHGWISSDDEDFVILKTDASLRHPIIEVMETDASLRHPIIEVMEKSQDAVG
ncbi:hypothetical protein HHK36_016228 [Tetracentron sinense]|uniref:WIYLD domain-containing protein n=1 Tax=Tetracentron sinense TaxID=13715 RepID=A0A834Z0D3_TETSI|nr:hypothetical protein HHK36_016228 [Tetracentron sinense]